MAIVIQELENEEKRLIIQSIIDATNDDVREYMEEHKRPTHNGLSNTKWDFINDRLVQALQTKGFECKICTADPSTWEYVRIHKAKIKMYYVVMRRSRYEEVVKESSHKKKAPHYTFVLSQSNSDHASVKKVNEYLFVDSEGQSAFYLNDEPNYIQIKKNEAEEKNKEVTHDMEPDAHFGLITFEEHKGNVISVKLVIPSDTTMESVSDEEDWSELIPAQFDSEIPVPGKLPDDEDQDPIVVLKDSALKRKDNVGKDKRLQNSEKLAELKNDENGESDEKKKKS